MGRSATGLMKNCPPPPPPRLFGSHGACCREPPRCSGSRPASGLGSALAVHPDSPVTVHPPPGRSLLTGGEGGCWAGGTRVRGGSGHSQNRCSEPGATWGISRGSEPRAATNSPLGSARVRSETLPLRWLLRAVYRDKFKMRKAEEQKEEGRWGRGNTQHFSPLPWTPVRDAGPHGGPNVQRGAVGRGQHRNRPASCVITGLSCSHHVCGMGRHRHHRAAVRTR